MRKNTKQKNKHAKSLSKTISQNINKSKTHFQHGLRKILHGDEDAGKSKKLMELAEEMDYSYMKPAVLDEFIRIRKDNLIFVPEYDVSSSKWEITINAFPTKAIAAERIKEAELEKAKMFCRLANKL